MRRKKKKPNDMCDLPVREVKGWCFLKLLQFISPIIRKLVFSISYSRFYRRGDLMKIYSKLLSPPLLPLPSSLDMISFISTKKTLSTLSKRVFGWRC